MTYDVQKTAYTLGAQVIEKHYTLDKTLSGNDHYHAMDEKDAANIIAAIEYIDKLRGNGDLKCLETEKTARLNARRSLVAACDIPAGTVITAEMLTFKRPGTGILAEKYSEMIGKVAKVHILEDDILKDEMF